mgnify:CR=1 FL=1
MAGGVPFAKNCGHCAKLVGSGVSSAALSNCGERAQERFGRATLARDRASTATRRTRPGQERKRFTEEAFESNLTEPDWSTVHLSLLLRMLGSRRVLQLLAEMGSTNRKGSQREPDLPARPCGSVNTPHGSATRKCKVPPPWEVPQLLQPISSSWSANYMALNSPWGIWPVRRASAAWARTAARSAVEV